MGFKIFDDDKFYSTDEIAKLMGISRSAVYKWIREKKVYAVKFGRYWKIKGSELNKNIVKSNFD